MLSLLPTFEFQVEEVHVKRREGAFATQTLTTVTLKMPPGSYPEDGFMKVTFKGDSYKDFFLKRVGQKVLVGITPDGKESWL